MTNTAGRITWRALHLLIPLITMSVILSCGRPPREAIVPVPPDEAVTRAVRVLESFDYNVLDVDREDGVVLGTRSAGAQPDVLWEVTVHVTPMADGNAARYRLESRATRTVELPSRRRSSESELPALRIQRVPPDHLDEIQAELADWRR